MTYVIKMTLGSTTATLTGTGWSITGTSDPSGNALSLNTSAPSPLTTGYATQWSITAPSASFNAATIGTYFLITYPTSFTGSFGNFRRYVYTSPASGPLWTCANYGSSATTGAVVNIVTASYAIYVNGMVATTLGAVVSSTMYFVFDYSSNNIFIPNNNT